MTSPPEDWTPDQVAQFAALYEHEQAMTFRVHGFCPACGHVALTVGIDGHITCGHPDCPQPDAVSELLADKETGHVVWLADDDFTIRHPLRERLGDELLNCQLHADLTADGPPLPPGKYRVPVGGTTFRAYDWETLPS